MAFSDWISLGIAVCNLVIAVSTFLAARAAGKGAKLARQTAEESHRQAEESRRQAERMNVVMLNTAKANALARRKLLNNSNLKRATRIELA